MRLLVNARILTLDPDNPQATGLLIDRGRILAVGDSGRLSAAYGDTAKVEDLAGATVLPGLIDAHVHLKHYGFSLSKIDCETDSLAECLARVRSRVTDTPEGAWVLGHGWQQNDWDDCRAGLNGFPNAAMLDAISDRHPIYLTAKSLHAGWANSAALRMAGLNRDHPDPAGGAFQRTENGELTGILLEAAMHPLSRAIPAESEASVRDALRLAQETLWSFGLTGIHDFDRRDCFVGLQQLQAAGALKLRVLKSIPVEDLDHAVRLGLRSGFGDDFLRIGNIKVFSDGALGPHTAAMIRPYEDDPSNYGMLLADEEQIFEYGAAAAENGFGMTIHAIGDAANHAVLQAYERLRSLERAHGLPAYRHRIEHVQLLHPADLDRLASLDVIASMQPIHAASDMHAAEKFWGERSAFAYAWRSLIDRGTKMAYGSDAPIESPNPFWGIYAAVSRRNLKGEPGLKGWRGEQRIRLEEALHGFTKGAAYAAGMENRLGMLRSGFHADLAVVDPGFPEFEPEQIRDTRARRTMVGGEWVFHRD